MKYTVLVEVVVRGRSSRVYVAWRSPWRWLALVLARLSFWFRKYEESEVLILETDRANRYLSEYRNWLGLGL